MSEDFDMRELERHVAQLGERFDSVRIIATSHRDGTTYTHSFGSGNFCAQTGAVREWLSIKDEEVRQSVKKCSDD